jgi:hypothetical protein
MSRLAMAFIAYSVLGALAFVTLSDFRIRTLTLLILAMFAFKSWVRRKEVLHPDGEDESN